MRSWGQVGQGPGWHNSTQLWPQSPGSGRSHLSPQVCGANHGSFNGSTCFPQKHRYSRGSSDLEYSDRHLGQCHRAFSSASAAAIGKCWPESWPREWTAAVPKACCAHDCMHNRWKTAWHPVLQSQIGSVTLTFSKHIKHAVAPLCLASNIARIFARPESNRELTN
jgi:hypothetical protein